MPTRGKEALIAVQNYKGVLDSYQKYLVKYQQLQDSVLKAGFAINCDTQEISRITFKEKIVNRAKDCLLCLWVKHIDKICRLPKNRITLKLLNIVEKGINYGRSNSNTSGNVI